MDQQNYGRLFSNLDDLEVARVALAYSCDPLARELASRICGAQAILKGEWEELKAERAKLEADRAKLSKNWSEYYRRNTEAEGFIKNLRELLEDLD